ncbi:hypothetical protein ACH4UM_20750 [Streptomyces sp. NPDC020801]|uniref:hypothetical protein n=1 Tax=unclassified Streptomyces TaxID=2593676 RepID=UPI003799DB6A
MRKTVVWAAALAAAVTSLASPAVAAQRPPDRDRPCEISGRSNEQDCLLQFELRPVQEDSIPGTTGRVTIQSLDAFQGGRAIGFVTGMMSRFDSGAGEGVYTLRLSSGQGQVGVQFAQPGDSQQTTPLMVTGGSGVFECATGSGTAEGGGNNSPILVSLHLRFLCGSH